VLALSEKWCEERANESAQLAKMAELEGVIKSQADKITELEATHADLKREKDNLHAGYRRLSEKHRALNEEAEQEKTKLAKAHAVELAWVHGDLDLETRSYTEYRQTVWHWHRALHETIASSFDEVKARCLPFSGKGAKVEEMIDWVTEEEKAVPHTVRWLNDNFTVLGIEGILNMLNDEGCQELGQHRDLAASRGSSALEIFLMMCIS
jgi:hypothetical protein